MTTMIHQAKQIALDFLMEDLGVAPEDREWFSVLSSRSVQENWYVVEVGVEGLPDKWVLQVWDTGVCDPSYTFVSPIHASDGTNDLEELPDPIAAVIASERQN